MADIDIQQKRGGGPLPWIIGLLLLALLGWGVYEMLDRDEPDVAVVDVREGAVLPAEPPLETPAEPTAGARFRAWVRDSAAAAGQMGPQHAYTRDALSRMATALEGLVARERAPDVERQLELIREQVREIEQSDPASTDHAGQAREAFVAGAELLEMLRQRPHLQQADLEQPVQSAREAAESVRANTPLLDQRAAVHRYFEQMADAIERAERHYLS